MYDPQSGMWRLIQQQKLWYPQLWSSVFENEILGWRRSAETKRLCGSSCLHRRQIACYAQKTSSVLGESRLKGSNCTCSWVAVCPEQKRSVRVATMGRLSDGLITSSSPVLSSVLIVREKCSPNLSESLTTGSFAVPVWLGSWVIGERFAVLGSLRSLSRSFQFFIICFNKLYKNVSILLFWVGETRDVKVTTDVLGPVVV